MIMLEQDGSRCRDERAGACWRPARGGSSGHGAGGVMAQVRAGVDRPAG